MSLTLENRLSQKLKHAIRAVEQLEQEKKEIAGAIKETLDEAKREGLDVKAIRRIISLRKIGRGEFEEQESTLQTYMSALGMR